MPKLDPVPNIGSQIERAVIAWLYDCFGGEVSRYKFYFSTDWKTRTPPLIEVFAHKSTETPTHSRMESFMVSVEARWKGTNVPGETNPDTNWKQINDFIGVVMAAMSQSDNDGSDFKATALAIAVAGRRLAVFGTPGIADAMANDITNNADMANFYCDYVEFKGSQRLGVAEGTLYLMEQRHFQINACNLADDSVFPKLTFDGAHALNWTFTDGAYPEPDFWVVEKSPSGSAWTMADTLASGTRTADITGSGTQFWRVRRSNDGTTLLDPESNIVKATA